MELLGYIAALPLATTEAAGEEGGSFLVSPGLGLMIWTLVLFLFTMWVLSKLAFPKIQEALDRRAKTIAESLDAAERQRRESDELLAEYRGRLAEAREQADDIMARARKAGETAEAEATAAGKEKREELVNAAKRDIEAETRRAIQEIRNEVADLTVEATERVVGKVLDTEDQRRLVREAVDGLDFSALERTGS
jgi:F-type H+-transporting ATPase subunit b